MLLHLPLLFLFLSLLHLSLSLNPSTSTSLSGHYYFSVVHDPPFMDTGADDNTILPKHLWTGLIIDHIQLISSHAGFTYELFIASGNGSHCTANASAVERSRNYLCTQDDVIELGLTHGFWSLFYATKDRLESGILFTTPFISNTGIQMLVLTQTPSFYDKALLLFQPFTKEMWVATFVMVVFVAATLRFSERTGAELRSTEQHILALESIPISDMRKIFSIKENIFSSKKESAMGWTINQFFSDIPTYIYTSWLTITAHSSHTSDVEGTGMSTKALVLNAFFCFFGMVWVLGYTANLAAILGDRSGETEWNTLEQLNMKSRSAAVTPNTAYAAAMAVSFPNIKQIGFGNFKDALRCLETEKCHALVEASILLEALQNGAIDIESDSPMRQYCTDRDNNQELRLVGSPRQQGYTDMAVGIHSDYPELRDVLSYWITAFRTCEPDSVTSACYSGAGMGRSFDSLTDFHVRKDRCGHLKPTFWDYGGEGEFLKLDVYNFLFPIAVVVSVGALMIIKEVFNICNWGFLTVMFCTRDIREVVNRCIVDKSFLASVELNNKLALKWVTSNARNDQYLSYDTKDNSSDKVLDITFILSSWWKSPNVREMFLGPLKKHYLATDIRALFILRWSVKKLEHELKFLTCQAPNNRRHILLKSRSSKHMYHHSDDASDVQNKLESKEYERLGFHIEDSENCYGFEGVREKTLTEKRIKLYLLDQALLLRRAIGEVIRINNSETVSTHNSESSLASIMSRAYSPPIRVHSHSSVVLDNTVPTESKCETKSAPSYDNIFSNRPVNEVSSIRFSKDMTSML